jgi:hypothetical protein
MYSAFKVISPKGEMLSLDQARAEDLAAKFHGHLVGLVEATMPTKEELMAYAAVAGLPADEPGLRAFAARVLKLL